MGGGGPAHVSGRSAAPAAAWREHARADRLDQARDDEVREPLVRGSPDSRSADTVSQARPNPKLISCPTTWEQTR